MLYYFVTDCMYKTVALSVVQAHAIISTSQVVKNKHNFKKKGEAALQNEKVSVGREGNIYSFCCSPQPYCKLQSRRSSCVVFFAWYGLGSSMLSFPYREMAFRLSGVAIRTLIASILMHETTRRIS